MDAKPAAQDDPDHAVPQALPEVVSPEFVSPELVSIEKAVLIDVALGAPLGRIFFRLPAADDGVPALPAPRTFLFRGEHLARMRQLAAQGEPQMTAVVAALVEAADAACVRGPFSVTDKPSIPEGADPHDYRSPAKYWWPDPASADGLPFIRRDGEVNPACYGPDSDYPRLVRYAETVTLLALAAYLAGEHRFAERAAALVSVWHLDEATRQTPHFRFAQTIPGQPEEQRWQGIVEARHIAYALEAIVMLEGMGAIPAAEMEGLRAWHGALLDWLLASDQGQQAGKARNNIGFWRDLLALALAQFVGRSEEVERIAREAVIPRLDTQIGPDGSLPRELARARPQDYVAFTIAAMALAGRAAEAGGVPIWGVETSDGRNFEAARDWLTRATRVYGGLAGAAAGGMGKAGPGLEAPGSDEAIASLLDAGLQLRGLQRLAAANQQAAETASRRFEKMRRRAEALEAEAEALREKNRHAAEVAAAQKAQLEARLEAEAEARREERRHAAEIAAAQKAEFEARLEVAAAQQAKLKAKLQAAAAQQAQLEAAVKTERAHRTTVAAETATAEAALQKMTDYARVLETRYGAMLESETWRAMEPVRRLIRLLRRRPPPPAFTPRLAGPTAGGSKKTTAGSSGGKTRARPAPADARPAPPGPASGTAAGTTAATTAGTAPRTDPAQERDLHRLRTMRPRDEDRLAAAYRASPLAALPDRFVLTRIIGNDLWPRHRQGQSRENLRFMLENEPALADCEKRWVVNRILDAEEEARILELLDAHGQQYLRIPFVEEDYRAVGWDAGVLPAPDFLTGPAFAALSGEKRERVITALYRLKNIYVMNNNGARNAALEDGRARAKWVLPWDGNCFVTAKAWEEIRSAVTARPHLRYFLTPMHRSLDNTELLRDDFAPQPFEEPQVLFRTDAEECFDERFAYGRRPKVELLWRLQVPGRWDRWHDDPWDPPRRQPAPEAGQFATAGWVARLFSGVSELETTTAAKQRFLVRQDAIRATIDRLDRRLGLPSFPGLPDRDASPEAPADPLPAAVAEAPRPLLTS